MPAVCDLPSERVHQVVALEVEGEGVPRLHQHSQAQARGVSGTALWEEAWAHSMPFSSLYPVPYVWGVCV